MLYSQQDVRRLFFSGFFVASCSMVALTGCGNSSDPAVTQSEPQGQAVVKNSAGQKSGLPTVSIPPQDMNDEFEKGLDDDETAVEKVPEPAAGTPEWNLKQIAIKRATISTAGNDKTPETQSAIAKFHYEIIDLAKGAIAMTHKDAEKQRIFDAACHALTESRLALAFSNHPEQIALLYDDAEAQVKRDATSVSAANSTFAIVRMSEFFANQSARKGPSEETEKWAKEYTRAVKHFVVKFPAEESRGAVALLNTGKFCEARRDSQGALECYSLLASNFPQSPFAGQVTGTVRRLSLAGKPVDLGGPTIDGGHTSVKDFAGKPILVIFWDTQSQDFNSQVDQMIGYLKNGPGKKLAIIGVNLDQDELAVDKYLEAHPLPGPQIFPLEVEQRRFASPIARYYGIRSAPQFWLIDQEGKLINSELTMQQIPAAVAGLK